MAELYFYQETLEFGPNEPASYASQDVVVFDVGTTTPTPVFSDPAMTVPIAGSRIRTNEFGELQFFSAASTVDVVRQVGGRRTTIMGDPGGVDELQFTKLMFFS